MATRDAELINAFERHILECSRTALIADAESRVIVSHDDASVDFVVTPEMRLLTAVLANALCDAMWEPPVRKTITVHARNEDAWNACHREDAEQFFMDGRAALVSAPLGLSGDFVRAEAEAVLGYRLHLRSLAA